MDIQQELEKIKKQLEKLTLDNQQLKQENEEIKGQLQKTNDRVEELLTKRSENYYQRYLERLLLAGHCKTKHGITDVTTKDEHIEIKHWNNYKSALGQLISYNFNSNKRLSAYFFGSVIDTKREEIIELYRSKRVSIKEFIDTDDSIKIQNILDVDSYISNNDFCIWLDQNIEYKKDELLQLKHVCENYLKKINIHSKESCKYKIEIEKWIKFVYPTLDYKFRQFNTNNGNKRGWLHLRIKPES